MKKMLHAWSARTAGRLLSAWPRRRVAILCYHSVHPTASFSLRPQAFEEHLRWLSEYCDIVSFSRILSEGCGNDKHRSRPLVALTFDDGYLDNYEIAVPLLVKYRLTATFFLTAGFLQRKPVVMQRFAAGWKVPSSQIAPMTWSQIRELLAGGMEVGAHGYSHVPLAALDETSALAELVTSKSILEDALNISIESMSYPYGKPGSSVTCETVGLAGRAGYQRAALVLFRGVRPGDSLLELPRFAVDGDSVQIMREKILGWWDPIGIWRERWARVSRQVSVTASSRRQLL